MSLNQQQLDSIKNWVANGAGIGEVQTRIKDEFGVVMTYIDVRFLIDDIGAELVSKPDPVPAQNAEAAAPEPPNPQSGDDLSDDYADGQSMPQDYPQDDAGGNVEVTVSPIQRPDSLVSGDVVFSDGTKAEWRIDRMGQLGLIPQDGKTPPQSDMYTFQRKLQEMLSRM
jgi:hypothetical protein